MWTNLMPYVSESLYQGIDCRFFPSKSSKQMDGNDQWWMVSIDWPTTNGIMQSLEVNSFISSLVYKISKTNEWFMMNIKLPYWLLPKKTCLRGFDLRLGRAQIRLLIYRDFLQLNVEHVILIQPSTIILLSVSTGVSVGRWWGNGYETT